MVSAAIGVNKYAYVNGLSMAVLLLYYLSPDEINNKAIDGLVI